MIKKAHDIKLNYLFVKTVDEKHKQYETYKKIAIESYDFKLLGSGETTFIKLTTEYALVVLEKNNKKIVDGEFIDDITYDIKLHLRLVLPEDDLND